MFNTASLLDFVALLGIPVALLGLFQAYKGSSDFIKGIWRMWFMGLVVGFIISYNNRFEETCYFVSKFENPEVLPFMLVVSWFFFTTLDLPWLIKHRSTRLEYLIAWKFNADRSANYDPLQAVISLSKEDFKGLGEIKLTQWLSAMTLSPIFHTLFLVVAVLALLLGVESGKVGGCSIYSLIQSA